MLGALFSACAVAQEVPENRVLDAREVQNVPGTDVSFELVLVPGGDFALGSPATEVGRDEDEGPQRRVSLDPFWIATTEVTHDLYALFRDRRLDTPMASDPDVAFDVDAVTRPSPPYEDPSHGLSGPGRPATGMTRLAALRFARWLSEKTGHLYRLPTEAEWEMVCRAGGEEPFGAGGGAEATVDARAWFATNSGDGLHPVATKAPNAWGVYDMQGNAAEWTIDPYDADFYASIPEDDSARNPSTGPSTRGRGVVRGGAFDDDLPQLRCADRFEETPVWKRRDPQIPKSRWWNTDSPHVGFRLVRPVGDYTPQQIDDYWTALLGER